MPTAPTSSLEDVSYGPAMKALTLRQRLFVENLLEHGDNNYTRAALAAGYKDNPASIRQQAAVVAHLPKVLAAIAEESRKRLHASGVMIVSEAIKIAKNGQHKDQLRAIEFVASRTGMGPHSEHHVVHDVRFDEKSLRREAEALCRELGLDVTAVLGRASSLKLPSPVEDAAFVEVTDDDGRDGLEDLL